MVVVATAIVAIFGALLGANHLLGPKVPLYEFQVLRLPLLWWTKWGEVSTTLYAQIQLHNDNVVRTNVHAASFDLFFPNTWTEGNDLVHIGHVMNINQYYGKDEATVVWSMPAKELFTIKDSVRLQIPISRFMTVLSSLLYVAVTHGGIIPLPSTGIVHIIAPPPHAKGTMAMVCDTTLNVWSLSLHGQACTMKHFLPGWWNMTNQVDQLQHYALEVLEWNPSTHSVLGSKKKKKRKKRTQALNGAN